MEMHNHFLNPLAVAKAEDIYKPLVMAIETKLQKMIVISVTSIHRLIVHGAVTPVKFSELFS